MYHLAFTLFFFFFNDTATTEIYTLSLHDALPISASFSELPTRQRTTAPSPDTLAAVSELPTRQRTRPTPNGLRSSISELPTRQRTRQKIQIGRASCRERV